MSVKTHILGTFLHIQETWLSVWETGRFSLYSGDSWVIWESWYRRICCGLNLSLDKLPTAFYKRKLPAV